MFDPSNWMSKLPDDIKLSKLSIPGTHDTMTFHDQDACHYPIIGVLCLTQNMMLYEQLMAGIRFIDIRIKQEPTNSSDLKIQHGDVYLDVTLYDVFKYLKIFLKSFNTETIIMSWEPYENGAIQDWTTLNRIFIKYAQNPHNLLYLEGYSNDEHNTPTLGEVRGKVVLLDFKNTPGYGSGAFDFGESTVLNNFEPSGIHCLSDDIEIATKCCPAGYVKELKENVYRAGAPMIEDQYYMTWVSFVPAGDFCRESVYDNFHKILVQTFNKKLIRGTGIVIMDFPKLQYINSIIIFNFQGK